VVLWSFQSNRLEDASGYLEETLLRMSKNRSRKMRKLRQIFEKLRQMAREMAKVAGFKRNHEKT